MWSYHESESPSPPRARVERRGARRTARKSETFRVDVWISGSLENARSAASDRRARDLGRAPLTRRAPRTEHRRHAAETRARRGSRGGRADGGRRRGR